MDTTYKTGLCAKLDLIGKLERNGYGLVSLQEAPMTLKEYMHEGGRAILGVLAIAVWALFLIII